MNAEAGKKKEVYMAFSAYMLHGGHIKIIQKASELGDLIIGVLSDEAVASYKRFPMLPFDERKVLFGSLKYVSRVVEQKEASYRNVILELKPDIVVHGDNWKEGHLKALRDEVKETASRISNLLT